MSEPGSASLQAPIAIVGLGSIFPGSETAEGFWRDIVLARDRMIDIPESHWIIEDYYDPDPQKPDRTYCKRGAFISPVEFDPLEFGIPPSILPATDTAQLLALIVAKNVLDDVSGGQPLKIDRDRTSVVLGFTGAAELVNPLVSRIQRPIWAKSLRESGIAESAIEGICDRIAQHYVPWQEASFPGVLGNVVAGRIANRLDLHGSNLTTDAACASALSAVHTAVNQLLLGESDLAITGGVDADNDIFVYMCFSKTPALSRSGDCRPFSAQADGTMLGEGIGMVALKRLADAERDRNRIYAVLRGIGSASDGRSKSIYAPRSDGQARALRRAYDRAGYEPGTVELLEAHGTGTKAGDAAEVEGLKSVFGAAPASGKPWCALGSVKSQIGHTKAAAGAAGLLKIAMALHQKVLPPTLKVERPDPELKLDQSPFYVNTVARPWIRGGGHPRRASVSSFGFGGTNYHVTLEEYVTATQPACTSSLRTGRNELFVFGAETSAALADRCRKMALQGGEPPALALASQRAYDASAKVRLAIVAESREDLSAKLQEADSCLRASETPSLAAPAGIYVASAEVVGGDVAFLFPGQGSQYVGMGADLAMAHGCVRRVWDRLADLRFDGVATHEVVFPPPVFEKDAREKLESRLRATEWAQPALGLASLAAFELIGALGLRPRCFIGHSFGELSALCAAGSIRIEDLLSLARARGEMMHNAARQTPGGMLALATTSQRAASLISRVSADAVLANLNAPDETVVSGSTDALQLIEEECAREQIAARRLPVAAAFHSPAVASVAKAFAEVLAEVAVGAPSVEVSGNADAEVYPGDPDAIRRRLAEQLARPVRYADQIEAAYARGVRTFVEVGPGSVLSDLVRRILKGRPHLAVSIDRKSRDGITSLHHALGQLATAGIALDFEPLWEGYAPPVRPAKRPGSTVTLTGTNFAKPYPPSAKQRAAASSSSLPAPRPSPPAPVALPTPPPLPAAAAPPSATAPHTAAAIPPSSLASEPSGGPDLAWIQAYQEIQRKTADTHAAFSRAMADSHASFIAAMESSFAQLSAMMGGQQVPQLAANPRVPLPVMADIPQTSPAPVVEERTVEPAPNAAPPVDLAALLLSIVAEKTGYQADMLGMHMDLEADLGIDSIKRVEILAALSDAIPSLPDVMASDMTAMRTLGDVVKFLNRTKPTEELPAPTTPVVSEAPIAAPALKRSGVRMVAEEAVGLSLAGLRAGGRVVVTDDGDGIARAVAGRLAEQGVVAEIVTEVPNDAAAVIFLGGLRTVRLADDAIAVNREAFRAARAVAARFADSPGVFVGVQDTGGDFGLSGRDPLRAWLGGIAGLVRTVNHEWPSASVKAIDCERDGRSADDIARAIVDELFNGGETLDVGLASDGSRRVPRLVPCSTTNDPPRLEEGSVVVASGGARGITAACLIELARTCRPQFVLLGRTELAAEPAFCRGASDPADIARLLVAEAQKAGRTPPPAEIGAAVRAITSAREVRETLDALERAGAMATYLPGDVQDAGAVRKTFDDIRARFGPIKALIHGAGVLADKRLTEKTDAQFDRVFDTKVEGLRALLEAAEDDELAWICLFSSFVAKAGNEGQCDYAMSNEILNLAACAECTRRGTTCVVRAIGWGPWEGGMVTPPLRKHFQGRGIPLIPLEAGARAFVAEGGAADDVVVMIGGESTSATPPPRRERDAVFDLWVDDKSYPYLKDHAVNGVPVVPIALVIEWFLRSMRGVSSGRTPVLRSLKVLRGIKLDAALRGELLRITRRFVDGTWRLELHGPGDTLCFSAKADFESSSPHGKALVEPAGAAKSNGRIYDGVVLFHGPAFQSLRSLEAMDSVGMSADVVGLAELGWKPEAWQTDPAAIDGMLQVGTKWSEKLIGSAMLPMAFEAFHLLQTGAAPGRLRTTARTRHVHHARVVCDVALATLEGDLVAVLSGAEFVLRPDLLKPVLAVTAVT